MRNSFNINTKSMWGRRAVRRYGRIYSSGRNDILKTFFVQCLCVSNIKQYSYPEAIVLISEHRDGAMISGLALNDCVISQFVREKAMENSGHFCTLFFTSKSSFNNPPVTSRLFMLDTSSLKWIQSYEFFYVATLSCTSLVYMHVFLHP